MLFRSTPPLLAAHIPLKQGLRPSSSVVFRNIAGARGAYSTKTRIKTFYVLCFIFGKSVLAAHIPLKQGLRHSSSSSNSLTTGLAAHIPLKQGLRLLNFFPAKLANCSLAAHIPLKQGLRRSYVVTRLSDCRTRGAYSTKTRIKTRCTLRYILHALHSRRIFH